MTSIDFKSARSLRSGRCEVLAEAGQCMEGSVERAVQMTRDAAFAGAWGIKTQMLKPETIAIENAPKYWEDDLGTHSQREAFAAAGLIDFDKWRPVREAARESQIAFVSTPFDLDAVEHLEALDVDAYKIASGDLLWRDMLDTLIDTRRPLFISTGAAWADEIESTVEYALARDPSLRYRLVLLACSLVYPTPAHEANVGRVVRLRELVAERAWGSVKVGYSDHTESEHTALIAGAAGAVLVEKHYTFAGAQGAVADHGMAVDAEGLAKTVNHARRGAASYGDASLIPTEREERARQGARRALYLQRDVRAGDLVESGDVLPLRPCPPSALPLDVWHDSRRDTRWRSSRKRGDFVRMSDLDL